MSNVERVEKLIEKYGNDILRIANSYTKNTTAAEDIFQEVFIKVFNKLSSFRNESNEKTWIVRIAINTCKDYLKSSWQKKVTSMEDYIEHESEKNIENDIIEKQNSSSLMNEILNLPVKYKEVLLLYYYQNFSTKEIAEILKIPEASVRTRMKRARELLKAKLEITLDY